MNDGNIIPFPGPTVIFDGEDPATLDQIEKTLNIFYEQVLPLMKRQRVDPIHLAVALGIAVSLQINTVGIDEEAFYQTALNSAYLLIQTNPDHPIHKMIKKLEEEQ